MKYTCIFLTVTMLLEPLQFLCGFQSDLAVTNMAVLVQHYGQRHQESLSDKHQSVYYGQVSQINVTLYFIYF